MFYLKRNLGVGIICLALLLTACAGPRKMMPTPNVHLYEDRDFDGSLDPRLKNTEVPLFFITDRSPDQDEQGNLRYGRGRSNSLAFDSAVVDLGRDITWKDLLEASRMQPSLKSTHLELREVKELARDPGTPLPYTKIDGKIVESPDLAKQNKDAKEAFRVWRVKDSVGYCHGW